MMRLRAAATLLFVSPLLFAQAPRQVNAPVPTTRVLAIGHITSQDTSDLEAIRALMPGEVRATVDIYLQGRLDQWFVRQDGNGVVFLLNASSTEDAAGVLSRLPLVESHRMAFDLIPLGPLSPLRFLIQRAPDATKP